MKGGFLQLQVHEIRAELTHELHVLNPSGPRVPIHFTVLFVGDTLSSPTELFLL